MPGKPKRIPSIITEEELNKICHARLRSQKRFSELDKFASLRDIVMFRLIYYNGLRPRECYNARLNYINLEDKTFYIPAISNKQRNQDTIPLQDFIVDILKKYLKLHNKYFKHSIYLFPSIRNNKPVYRGTFIRAFKKSVRGAGLLKYSYTDKQNNPRYNLTLYSLRHSFATLCYLKTKDLRKTAVMLRHRDFMCRSTLIYIHTADNLNKRKLLDEIFEERKAISQKVFEI